MNKPYTPVGRCFEEIQAPPLMTNMIDLLVGKVVDERNLGVARFLSLFNQQIKAEIERTLHG